MYANGSEPDVHQPHGFLVWKIERTKIEEIPFHQLQIVRFQKGWARQHDPKLEFRYSRSLVPVRGYFRVILQLEGDETYLPYVFDIRKNEMGALEIRPDSDPAREVWIVHTHPKRPEFIEILEAIYDQDIDPQTV